MRKKHCLLAFLLAACCIQQPCSADAPVSRQNREAKEAEASLQIRIVNFKICVEKSKLGQQEQSNFEELKKKMEALLEQKEKELQDVAAKFNDPDYLDSLSSEAENELKHKFRSLSQDVSQDQNFYMQTLNQTNLRVMQKLNDAIEAAAERVSKNNGYHFVFNKEMSFYYNEKYDISKDIVRAMDEQFEKENKK